MNVLHLDRSQFFQKVVKQAGQLDAVNYFGASSIKDAWSQLEIQPIDLILSGQELEDGSAEVFLKKLDQSGFSHIPVIIITSSESLETREHYFNLGVVDYIPKTGFNSDKLKEHLEYFHRQDSMIQNLREGSIAILDDSRLSLNVITSILKMHEITHIETFVDPKDLLAKTKAYDIYFIDLMLPGISGERVVIELRKHYPDAVIIVISSLDKYSTIVHVLESGADDYVIKPFDSRLLMARLKSNFRHFKIIGELKEQRNAMKRMSITDSLTGAYNHRYLVEHLNAEILRCKEKNCHMSLMLLDIDKFKNVNDTYGHPAGDLVLKELVNLFKEFSRDSDIFGRYGGEEFLLIMPGTALSKALSFADEMRQRFSELEIDGIHHPLSFSGGLIQWQGESMESALKQVDELLYRAKNEGRNRIIY